MAFGDPLLHLRDQRVFICFTQFMGRAAMEVKNLVQKRIFGGAISAAKAC